MARWAVLLSLALASTSCRTSAQDGTASTTSGDDAAAWSVRSDAELARDIAGARERAAASGKRVLLEFVAPWCPDCREMTRLDASPSVARVLTSRYERVRVNVGQYDLHTDLLARYGIDRLATYVVLDPASGERVAQTTLEPVTTGRGVSAEAWIAWLESPR